MGGVWESGEERERSDLPAERWRRLRKYSKYSKYSKYRKHKKYRNIVKYGIVSIVSIQ